MAGLGLSSCQKEGCTDLDAVNLDEKAKDDDGSCIYAGTQIFWYGEETALFLYNNGVTSLTFYLNGNVVGSTNAEIYRTVEPSCGDELGTVVVDKDLGSFKTQAYTLSVKAQDNTEIWNTTVNFNANSCNTLELTVD